ncbi:flagellar basal body rod protein FlgB [Providencia sneebia]|uniref:Flagellar basal body rod protein FlgB n=1 Tax=Providencia sneebia DSM 19967 TaxID=1141660 RepID=K8WF54_9GAMM|nr:flagellar basal body rod protein FlgB [Providencia sneebia]EKT58556.1 flagellar basal body rod protein FlgB [Providencia sneebia DSM 19967]
MIDKLNSIFTFQQKALSIREVQQAVLASNIANADTPGYQSRAIDFNHQLKQVIHHNMINKKSRSLTITNKSHIERQGTYLTFFDLKYRVPYQTAMDGNTVDMDIERSHLLDNTLKYQADLTFINNHIKNMQSVLQQG